MCLLSYKFSDMHSFNIYIYIHNIAMCGILSKIIDAYERNKFSISKHILAHTEYFSKI